MAPKELTRQQVSSRLTYQGHTPSFLQKFKNRMEGIPDDDDDPYEEFEYDGSGRPPIPKRPPIPQRPPDNPGSADELDKLDEEDADDERPQVVVLKEGRHLTEREAENERRRVKGLSPVEDSFEALAQEVKGGKGVESRARPDEPNTNSFAKPAEDKSGGLSFSSSRSASKAGKRKAIGDLRDEAKQAGSSVPPPGKGTKKKAKKPEKKLLSFGDDA